METVYFNIHTQASVHRTTQGTHSTKVHRHRDTQLVWNFLTEAPQSPPTDTHTNNTHTRTPYARTHTETPGTLTLKFHTAGPHSPPRGPPV